MLAAMTVLPIGDGLSKHLVSSYPPDQVTWMRNLCHFLLLVPFLARRRCHTAWREMWSLAQLVRGVAFVAMTLSYVTALIWMPLTDALAIVFLFPLIVTILSAVFLREDVRAVHICAVGFGFGGAVLVIQPGLAMPNLGWPFALVAAFCTAVYVILTRQLSERAPPVMLLAVPALIGSVTLAPVALWRWVSPNAFDLFLMMGVGGLAALTHLLIILAYRRSPASQVAPLGYFQIVVASLLSVWFFGDVPGALTVLGMIIILLSGAMVSFWAPQRRV